MSYKNQITDQEKQTDPIRQKSNLTKSGKFLAR